MRRHLIFAIAAASFGCLAQARIGETPEELNERYGAPIRESIDSQGVWLGCLPFERVQRNSSDICEGQKSTRTVQSRRERIGSRFDRQGAQARESRGICFGFILGR